MDEKQTNRITLDELARMVNEGFNDVARKTDVDRLETNMAAWFVKLESAIDKIPERVVERLMDWATLKAEHDRIKRILKEKLGAEV